MEIGPREQEHEHRQLAGRIHPIVIETEVAGRSHCRTWADRSRYFVVGHWAAHTRPSAGRTALEYRPGFHSEVLDDRRKSRARVRILAFVRVDRTGPGVVVVRGTALLWMAESRATLISC